MTLDEAMFRDSRYMSGEEAKEQEQIIAETLDIRCFRCGISYRLCSFLGKSVCKDCASLFTSILESLADSVERDEPEINEWRRANGSL